MKNTQFLSLSILGLWVGLSAHGAGSTCGNLFRAHQIFECALENHPLILQAQASLEQSSHLIEIAQQRPNPEFDSDQAFGRSEDRAVLNTNLSFNHIFELGDKRSSRIAKASAEIEIMDAGLLQSKEEAALETAVTLFRLRQIRTEMFVIREALQTFAELKTHLLARHRITPEQSVILTTFKLVESDYKISLAQLDGEEGSLRMKISFILGRTVKPEGTQLPSVKTGWPHFSLNEPESILRGSQMLKWSAELKLAEREVSLAESSAWPNLKVGPVYQINTQGGVSYQAFGFNLSAELPIYQRNEGGKAFAESGVDRLKVYRLNGIRKLLNDRGQEIFRYQAALEAFKANSALSNVNRHHGQMETLFKSGLIQSANVIETHRQLVDLTRNVNRQELAAVEALWKLYALEGRILREKL